MHAFEIWRLMEEKRLREAQNENTEVTSRVETAPENADALPEPLPESNQEHEAVEDDEADRVKAFLDKNGLVAIPRESVISPVSEFGVGDKPMQLQRDGEFLGYIKFSENHIKVCMEGSQFYTELVAFKD